MGLLTNKILGIDSRKKKRTPICVLVEEPGKQQDYLDKSVDISQNGMFVMTETPKEKGEPVTLRFALPGQPPITVNGKVARIEKPRKILKYANEGMAIQFTQLDEQSEKILEQFIG